MICGASYRSSVVGRAGVADMLVRRRLVRGVSFPLHSLLPLLSFRFGGSSGYLVCENMNVCLAAAFVPDYWKGLRCSTVNVLSLSSWLIRSLPAAEAVHRQILVRVASSPSAPEPRGANAAKPQGQAWLKYGHCAKGRLLQLRGFDFDM